MSTFGSHCGGGARNAGLHAHRLAVARQRHRRRRRHDTHEGWWHTLRLLLLQPPGPASAFLAARPQGHQRALLALLAQHLHELDALATSFRGIGRTRI